jgi:hypothetical protein
MVSADNPTPKPITTQAASNAKKACTLYRTVSNTINAMLMMRKIMICKKEDSIVELLYG